MVYSFFSDHAVIGKGKFANCIILVPQPVEIRQGRPVVNVDVNYKTTLSDLIGSDSWFIFDGMSADSN